MCGICGVLNLSSNKRTERLIVQQMLEMVSHLGPDGVGIYSDKNIALGNTRLSIIDLETGDQPYIDEDGTL
jgi:asparagine synthase (glutamine-hydrolysing)